ncbi:MAG: TonB-dependent receptor [Muribaculaceae bacterium]|nr:TonB-dependent receptor [Muribaculaceae bacterium]
MAEAAVVEGFATDSTDGSPLVSCAVAFEPWHIAVQTDIDGRFSVNLPSGTYTVKASYLGFEPYSRIISIGRRDTSIVISMKPAGEQLREVTITAKESGGLTSSSRIDRAAMAHLQPSSFTDLLELLPGNISQNPDMGKVNSIRLRETGTVGATGTVSDNADYAMSALGTAFNVDGAPIVNDANHQSVGIEEATGRNSMNRGVDMRTLATDNIESVEVVRGIPSAEYGNLTSGVVNIRRSRKATPLTARFKADGYSKLLYIGKGLTLGRDSRNTLNADLGWLDSKTDPRNSLENFRRITASLRASLTHENSSMLTEWAFAADYTGTVDRAKSDPDLSLVKIDEYKADNHRGAIASDLSLSLRSTPLLRRIDLKLSASYSLDRLTRRKQVAPSRPVVAPVSNSAGVHDGVYNLEEYIADYLSEGKPLSIFTKLGLKGDLPAWAGASHGYKLGSEWTLSKNYGRGQVYDPMRPLSASWTSRPRAYSSIPAVNVVSVYAEDAFSTPSPIGRFDIQAGVHGIALAGLDRRYAMAGKMYFDPRVNATLTLPALTVAGRRLELMLAGGYGVSTRMPTADYLYPQPAYLDILQLGYYSTERPAELSRVNIRTYINDATNYSLKPARNHKWEVRAGVSLGANRLSMTYFEEHLNSGFRYSNVYDAYGYTRYDASGIKPGELTAPPDISTLPSTDERVLRGYRRAENGSRIDKRGIEFQLNTARWKPLATSLIVTGAWFRSRYSNSQMLFDPVSDVVGGTAVSDLFVGLYKSDDGRVSDQFNTNFMFDTQLPKLGLVFSTTVQCMWFVKTRRLPQNGTPDSYISAADGLLHHFDASQAETDEVLRYLIRHYNPQLYDTYTVPPALYVNLKATKTIGKWLRVALFVNRILDYLPAYSNKGLTVRRSSDAYFGMELNFTL